jgi:glutathione S-transferase
MANIVARNTGIVVHHLNNSRSQRILWMLVRTRSVFIVLSLTVNVQEEMELPYEIKKYQRTSEMLAPKELRAVHPLGLSPIITDGDVVLAESGAIIGKPTPFR